MRSQLWILQIKILCNRIPAATPTRRLHNYASVSHKFKRPNWLVALAYIATYPLSSRHVRAHYIHIQIHSCGIAQPEQLVL